MDFPVQVAASAQLSWDPSDTELDHVPRLPYLDIQRISLFLTPCILIRGLRYPRSIRTFGTVASSLAITPKSLCSLLFTCLVMLNVIGVASVCNTPLYKNHATAIMFTMRSPHPASKFRDPSPPGNRHATAAATFSGSSSQTEARKVPGILIAFEQAHGCVVHRLGRGQSTSNCDHKALLHPVYIGRATQQNPILTSEPR